MTKAEQAKFEELQAYIGVLEGSLAELTRRVEALESKPAKLSVVPNGITRDAKTGLIIRIDQTCKVTKAGRTSETDYYVILNGERVSVTERVAAFWHKKLSAQVAA